MVLLYNIGILLYSFLVRLTAIFNPKAKLFVKGRKDLLKKIKIAFSNNTCPVAWFHCASLGEFEQARPLMEAFNKTYPDYKILLTFFSPSGYEIRNDYPLADWVFYLPIDRPSRAKKFIEITNPKVAFIIKYEYWYNLIKYTRRKKVPILSVSSIFRKDQIFFKPYGKLFRRLLGYFDHFFVQDNASLKLLQSINIKHVSKSGDTRFDRVKGIRDRVKPIPVAEHFSKGSDVFVIGSCWPQDMEVLMSFINDRKDIKFIIAPHTLEEKFINKLQIELLRETIKFSEAEIPDVEQYEVLIIDNIGMLSGLYQYGKYAYVGGAFGQGLHNILEPATFGLPVFFGNNNYQKFREARELINVGGAFAVESYSEFRKAFKKVEDPETYQMISGINSDYVKENAGATDIILNYCKNELRL
ncbi:MAG: 3-deoxy-D-manno-octulosonic acid transferase [Candidatus Cyclobacteriaceae bacterium M2_1C_046]